MSGQEVIMPRPTLCMFTPVAIGWTSCRESARVVEALGDGPPNRAKLPAIMRRHGLTAEPPPVF
jgi:hypothetical protein